MCVCVPQKLESAIANWYSNFLVLYFAYVTILGIHLTNDDRLEMTCLWVSKSVFVVFVRHPTNQMVSSIWYKMLCGLDIHFAFVVCFVQMEKIEYLQRPHFLSTMHTHNIQKHFKLQTIGIIDDMPFGKRFRLNNKINRKIYITFVHNKLNRLTDWHFHIIYTTDIPFSPHATHSHKYWVISAIR